MRRLSIRDSIPYLLGLSLLGCSGVQTAFDPGLCRTAARTMPFDTAINGRLNDSARWACWTVDAEAAGTVRIELNLDAPSDSVGTRLRLTDDIGRPLQQTAAGGVTQTSALEFAVTGPTRLIVELSSTAGETGFGMKASFDASAPADLDLGGPDAADSPDAGPPDGGRDQGGRKPTKRDQGPPPPEKCRITGRLLRLIPAGRHLDMIASVKGANAACVVDWTRPTRLDCNGTLMGTVQVTSPPGGNGIVNLQVTDVNRATAETCKPVFFGLKQAE